MGRQAKRTVRVDASLLCPREVYRRGVDYYQEAFLRFYPQIAKDEEVVLFDPIQGEFFDLEERSQIQANSASWARLESPSDLFRFRWAVGRGYRRFPAQPGEVLFFPFSGTGPFFWPKASVVVVHDLIPSCYPPRAEARTLGPLRDLFEAQRMKSATRIITVSRHTQKDADKVWGPQGARCEAIPHLILPPPDPPANPSDRVRRLLERRTPYLLFLGAREARKGIDRLLELWEERRPEGVLLVLASPPTGKDPATEARLKRLVDRKDVVHLPDVDQFEKASLLQGARALVFPSRYEGYGLPAAEALFLGTPVVSFSNTSIPEVVIDGARMLRDGDFGGLLKAALEIATLDEKYQSWSRRARQRSEEMDVLAAARSYQKVFQSARDEVWGEASG